MKTLYFRLCSGILYCEADISSHYVFMFSGVFFCSCLDVYKDFSSSPNLAIFTRLCLGLLFKSNFIRVNSYLLEKLHQGPAVKSNQTLASFA